MTPFLGEVIGTGLLILLGNGGSSQCCTQQNERKGFWLDCYNFWLGNRRFCGRFHCSLCERRTHQSGRNHWLSNSWDIPLGESTHLPDWTISRRYDRRDPGMVAL